jgi:hypothetical protein
MGPFPADENIQNYDVKVKNGDSREVLRLRVGLSGYKDEFKVRSQDSPKCVKPDSRTNRMHRSSSATHLNTI